MSPIIGKDKEATERAKQKMQELYEAIKQKLEEIKEELLKDKDYSLSERRVIPFSAPIDLLITYPGLERTHSREYIESLKKSIEESGILHKPICTLDFMVNNILVALADKKGTDANIKILVVCGNARIQACRELGYHYVDVLLKYLTPDEAFQLSLTENEEREELNPIDRAILFKNWIEKTGISQHEIARRRGKTQGWVFQHLRLLKLPKKVQELIRQGKVTFLQAQKLLQIDDADTQIKLAELCAEGISYKELEAQIEKAKLKLTVNNILVTPAPIEPEPTPPRPVIPPSPKPPINPPKMKDEAEIIKEYIKQAIEKATEMLKGKEDKYGKLFLNKFLALSIIVEKCDGKCQYCKYIKGCAAIFRILQQHYGTVIYGVWDIIEQAK